MDKDRLNLSINVTFYVCLFCWVYASAYCLGSNVYVATIIFTVLAVVIYSLTFPKFCTNKNE